MSGASDRSAQFIPARHQSSLTSLTTQQIGGDWYDAMALPGQRAYLAVGDVVGHGLTAAEDMTQLRNAGLIERRGEDLEEGITRVAERLQAWQPGAPLGSLCDELIASLGTEPQLDDMCVLAVSRPGPDRAQPEPGQEPRG